MFAALGPPGEGMLRHPDDLSELGSGVSFAPAPSAISVNPFLQPQMSNEYLRRPPPKLATVNEAGYPDDNNRPWATSASNNPPPWSRASAEPPTDPSRENAMRSLDIHEAPRPLGFMPSLPLSGLGSNPPYPSQNLEGMKAWHGESEIDRLIREKLEGQHSYRAHTGKSAQRLAENHLSWGWQAVDAVVDGGWALLEGLKYSGNVLLGRLPAVEPSCKRVQQAVPIVIQIDDDDEDIQDGAAPMNFQDPGDEFSDMVSQPAVTREPVPDRIRTQLPAFTPIGKEGLSPSSWPGSETSHFVPPPTEDQQEQDDRKKASRGGRRPGDTASALSMSSAMTSSAAALLGGFTAKVITTSAAEADLTTGTAQSSASKPEQAATKKQIRAGDSKTVLASSAMKSSAASSLGAFISKPAAAAPAESTAPAANEEDPELTAAIRASMEDSAASPAPKRSAQAKSVLAQSSVMKSSAAGALGGFLAASSDRKAAPAVEPVDSQATTPVRETAQGELTTPEPQPAPKPQRVPGQAKSVLAQSNVMSSSAAGALGSLIAGGARAAPRPAEPFVAEPADDHGSMPRLAEDRPATSSRTRGPDDRKSALAASTVMTSSAASTLGALSAAPRKPPTQRAESPADAEMPASSVAARPKPPKEEGSGDRSGSASAKPKPRAKANTVISGLNTSSSASALLGPMMQAKPKAKPRPGDAKSTIG